jgi:hypothetical protein
MFEDLHWIDTETQALLDSLVESLPTARLLLLVNYRPEYQHGWSAKSYYQQLHIDPLSPETTDELLKTLLSVDPTVEPLRSWAGTPRLWRFVLAHGASSVGVGSAAPGTVVGWGRFPRNAMVDISALSGPTPGLMMLALAHAKRLQKFGA